jgi:uncharacterized damage-inducible protein DinB
MKARRSLLDEALEAWRDARLGFLDEVRNIPASQFDFRPAPEARSVRELGVHVLEVAMMMVGELARADTNFQRAPWPKLLAMHARAAYAARTRAEVLELLRTQLADGESRFRDAGELHMLQLITRFDGEPGTRLAWFHHGIAQEEYHRGQLATYARLLGREPALTQSIRGAS